VNESTVELLDAWRLFDINGGCLSAVALRSALASTDHDRPISISCHFLTRAATGPARVVTRPLRRGPRADAVETTIEQDGTPVLTAVTWAGSRCDGLAHDDATMPDAPGPEYLATYGQGDEPPPMWFPIYDLLEEKPVVPVDEAFLNEVRRPIYQGWFRDKG
jgi:acyl-CoA thioesterase